MFGLAHMNCDLDDESKVIGICDAFGFETKMMMNNTEVQATL